MKSLFKKILDLVTGEKEQTQAPVLPTNDIRAKSKINMDELTDEEISACKDAQLDIEDGLFLKALTKHSIEKLMFIDTGVEKPNGICSLTTEDNARKFVIEHQDRFVNMGKYLFINEVAYNGYKVAILGGTSDPYEVMEYAETNGANYDISGEDIIEKYKKWDNEFGIKPIGIGCDFCECEIQNKSINFKKLADEVYEFCPDVVDQGTYSIELLAEEMKKTGTIFLWWD
jgi:hypothetical protein